MLIKPGYMDYSQLAALGIALGLGLLVGFQRERAHSRLAGIRTFALITMLGTLTGFIAESYDSSWIVAAGGLSLALLIVSVNLVRGREEGADLGQTTEVAALLMYAVGAYLVIGNYIVATAVGGVVAVLLHLKKALDDFSVRMAAKDATAIMQFVAISLIILPILPNQNFGPYGVLNAREIWMMVVLIVGISIAGYFIYKFIGEKVGTVAAGILGGLISSTATTVTYARRAKDLGGAAHIAAFIITTASAIAFVRVIIEVAAVAPGKLGIIAPPLLLMTAFMAIVCLVLYFLNRKSEAEKQKIPEPENPAQLKSALVFAALYAVILVAVAAAKNYFGESGLYVVSIISGLTDVDAITLSLANQTDAGNLEAVIAWKLILIASLSNLVFKGGMALVLGHPAINRYIITAFGLSLAAGLLILWLWPEGWTIGALNNLEVTSGR